MTDGRNKEQKEPQGSERSLIEVQRRRHFLLGPLIVIDVESITRDGSGIADTSIIILLARTPKFLRCTRRVSAATSWSSHLSSNDLFRRSFGYRLPHATRQIYNHFW